MKEREVLQLKRVTVWLTLSLLTVVGWAWGQSNPPSSPATSASEKISFSLPFPADQGGGQVRGEAEQLDYQEDGSALLVGGVIIRYQDITISAIQVSVDLQEKMVEARGNVIVDQGPSRITGATATFDLTTKTGTLTQASAALEGDLFFSGESLSKTSEQTYRIENGVFTACQGVVPPWSFRAKSAEIEVDGYARIKQASMRVKSMPVFYLPYILWPTKTDRSSGLLVPKAGSSSDRGGYLGLAYYKTFGRSYDATIYADLWTKDFLALGTEFRYNPSDKTIGKLQGYSIWDPETDEQEWKIQWNHQTRSLPFGLRGVLHYEDYSDFGFFRRLERRLNDNSKNAVYASGFVNGSWGNHSFNLLVDRRQDFSKERDKETQQLPELQYKLRSTQIGRLPVYFSLDTGANYFSVDKSELYQGEYGRFDFSPKLKIPLSSWPWLAASITLGERFTWYEDTVTAEGPLQFRGDPLSRSVPYVTAEFIGPSFSKVFEDRPGAFEKLKHIVEPRFDYHYAETYEDQKFVPDFDEVDTTIAGHQGRVALINRLLGKPRAKPPSLSLVDPEDRNRVLTVEPASEATAVESSEDPETAIALPSLEVDKELVAPVVSFAPLPEYTVDAEEARTEGLVKLRLRVEEDGHVSDAEILKGLPMGLGISAQSKVTEWRFEPATLNGVPVAVFYEYNVNFSVAGVQIEPAPVEVSDTSSREIASFEVSRLYSFDDTFLEQGVRPVESTVLEGEDPPPGELVGSSWGLWRTSFIANPSSRFRMQLDLDYSGLFAELTRIRASGTVGFKGGNRVGFSWSPSYEAVSGATLSDQAALSFTWAIIPKRLTLRSAINYDIEGSLIQDQRHFLTYKGSCYTFKLEYHQSKNALSTRSDYLFSVDLKNVGTFLDINGGDS